MNFLFTTDWHLDDQPQNEYRWKAFDSVREAVREYEVGHVYNLGDMIDRKDRFSGAFVNRLIHELEETGKHAPITVLRGNHDSPLRGPAFFEFVNRLAGRVHYVTEPTADGVLLLLPFTPTPAEDWAGINFADFKAALMHVTVEGAVSENGTELVGTQLPPIPRGMRLFSGDVHVPQQIKKLGLTYVGCPHPIKFGDKFPPRMLVVDGDSFDVVAEVPVRSLRKHAVEVGSLDELRALDVDPGDHVRVKFNLSTDDVERLGEVEAALSEWARERRVEVRSSEFAVQGRGDRLGDDVDLDVKPETLLRQFGEAEELADDLMGVGDELLREVG